MSDWLFHLPVVWMALVVTAITALLTCALYWAVLAAAARGWGPAFTRMSPVMLTPLSVVFGLLVGFLAAQVWGDAERASTAVTREASALRTVAILSANFPDEPARRLRTFVRRHIQDAVNEEWPAMATHRASLTLVSRADIDALQFTLAIAPENQAQTIAQREIVAALEGALEARRQRIVISESSINWVRWSVVIALAGLILLIIAMVHCDNRRTVAVSMGIFAAGVAACLVLIAAHNRPFTGELSVRPKLLLQVMPEE